MLHTIFTVCAKISQIKSAHEGKAQKKKNLTYSTGIFQVIPKEV